MTARGPASARPDHERLPPRPRWTWALGAVAVFLVFAIARGGSPRPPDIRVDCAHAAIALSSHSVREKTVVRWAATGPAGTHVVLAVGGARLEPAAGGKLRVVPPSGKSDRDVQAASHGERLDGCRATGWFAVAVPAGDYDVRMFRVDGTGAAMTTHPIASTRLTVTPR